MIGIGMAGWLPVLALIVLPYIACGQNHPCSRMDTSTEIRDLCAFRNFLESRLERVDAVLASSWPAGEWRNDFKTFLRTFSLLDENAGKVEENGPLSPNPQSVYYIDRVQKRKSRFVRFGKRGDLHSVKRKSPYVRLG